MKIRLHRGDERVEFSRHGRVVFEQSGDSETEHGFFDDAAAEAALNGFVAQRYASGWVDSPETVAKRTAASRDAAHQRARLQYFTELCRLPTHEAFRKLASASLPPGERFEQLVAHVSSVEQPSPSGVHVKLDDGSEVLWDCGDAEALVQLWLTPAGTLDHEVYFATDGGAGPPVPPAALHDVEWFLQELPGDAYWFVDEADQVRCYEFDGGLRPGLRLSREQVLLEALLRALS